MFLKTLLKVYWWYCIGFLGKRNTLKQRCCRIFRTTWDLLGGGIKENIREAKVFLKPQNPRLPRLYLPLLFINIYRKESGVGEISFEKFGAMEFGDRLWETKDKELIEAKGQLDGHEFSVENFSFNGNNVVFLDYGGDGFLEFITRHGEKIEKVLMTFLKKQ